MPIIAVVELIACLAVGLGVLRVAVRDWEDPFAITDTDTDLSYWHYFGGWVLYGWAMAQGAILIFEVCRKNEARRCGLGRWAVLTTCLSLSLLWLVDLVHAWSPWKPHEQIHADELLESMLDVLDYAQHRFFDLPALFLAGLVAGLLSGWHIGEIRVDYREWFGRVFLILIVLWWVSGVAIRFLGPSVYPLGVR